MQGEPVVLADTDGSVYRVGQVWAYQTRPSEPWSTLTVLKVESHPDLGNIVHISLDGLKLNGPEGISPFIYHLPLTEKALAVSTFHVQREDAPLPSYRPGYDRWRDEFERGTASVWTLPVAGCLDAIEKMMTG